MKMTIYEKEDLIGQLRYCRAWAKQSTEKRYTKNWAKIINKLEKEIANAEITENWVTEWMKAMHK